SGPHEFAVPLQHAIDYQVRETALTTPDDERALLDVCGALAQQPIDRARPLWEITIIEGLTGGRAAMLQKIHHTVTDGVGGLKLSIAMVDLERDPAPTATERLPRPTAASATPVSATRDAVVDAAQRS